MKLAADWDLPTQAQNFETIWAHRAAENVNDVDAIMDTIATDTPRYVVVEADKPLQIIQDVAGVREFYTAARRSGSRGNGTSAEGPDETRIATDWYMMVTLDAHFMFDGLFEGVDRTGMEYSIPSVTLLPANSDGILGEFLYWPYTLHDGVRAAIAGKTLMDSISGSASLPRCHERFLQTLQTSNVSKLDMLAADAIFVVRDYDDPSGPLKTLEGRDTIAEYYASLLNLDGPANVNVLVLVTTPWYVFAEYLWTFEGAGSTSTIRTATIYGCDQTGHIHRGISYGTPPFVGGGLERSYGAGVIPIG